MTVAPSPDRPLWSRLARWFGSRRQPAGSLRRLDPHLLRDLGLDRPRVATRPLQPRRDQTGSPGRVSPWRRSTTSQISPSRLT